MGALRSIQLETRFAMLRGALESPCIAYESWGTQNAAEDNSILIFTGLSPSAHVASSVEDPSTGWWEDMVGPGKPIDSNRYHIICMNSLGSCFGTTGACSIDPARNEAYRLNFPVLSIEDIANAGAVVLDHLGIERLHAVVGSSMGGMTALAFVLLHPERAASLVSISSAARSEPFSIALRSLQREMIRRDPEWRNGQYDLAGLGPITGMRMARKLGMITYRSAAEWTQRFGRERAMSDPNDADPFGIDFEIEAYLEAHANKFIGSFDANCYLFLSRAMDLFDITDYGGSLKQGLSRVNLERALIIGVESDFLFPLHQQRELADGLQAYVADTTFIALPSIQGHDSFLVDMDRFRPVVCDFLACEGMI